MNMIIKQKIKWRSAARQLSFACATIAAQWAKIRGKKLQLFSEWREILIYINFLSYLFWIMHPTTYNWVCYPKEKFFSAKPRPLDSWLEHWSNVLQQYTVILLILLLDILFPSNHNIHKSSCGLCFWASDPLIERL